MLISCYYYRFQMNAPMGHIVVEAEIRILKQSNFHVISVTVICTFIDILLEQMELPYKPLCPSVG